MNRQKHFDAIRSRLRHMNSRAFEVSILTKDRKKKAMDELSKSIQNMLDVASARRQSRISTARSRLRSHTERAVEQRNQTQKKAAEMLSKKVNDKLVQASLKRQGELNARKSKLQKEFMHSSKVKERRDIARKADEILDDQSAKCKLPVPGDRTSGNAPEETEAPASPSSLTANGVDISTTKEGESLSQDAPELKDIAAGSKVDTKKEEVLQSLESFAGIAMYWEDGHQFLYL